MFLLDLILAFSKRHRSNAASGVSSRSQRGWPAKNCWLSLSFDADSLGTPKINKCYFELLFRSSAKINSPNKPELTDHTLVAGGLAGIHPGRVGDSPLPGCGYYADNHLGAVAFSGDGEHIARKTLAARGHACTCRRT
ncbi:MULTISPECIES: isoaspartyl peptidase/L-asparaginase [unclassified Mesorhizobium]|uniref:isoaspartyl peptidase/L-asparaginase n=1 Tax=unclassified Mesorhizobium TaxID=325217 RepID=UPI00333C4870